MSETFSNEEQINLCKQEVHDKHFGKLEAMQSGLRDSSRFRFQDCENEAGNNVVKFVMCIREYKSAVQSDTDAIVKFINAGMK